MDADVLAYQQWAKGNGVNLGSADPTHAARAAAPAPAKKDNSWLSIIPSALAAGASLIPGVGTMAATGLGAAGEALRQRMAGENTDFGKIAQEAALSAIPGGLGKLAKAASIAKDVKLGGNVVNDVRAATDAAKQAKAATASGGAAEAATTTARPNLLQRTGQTLTGSARGIKPGTTVPGQDQLGVADAAAHNDFLNSVGIKPSSAKDQLDQLEQLHKGWGTQLDTALSKANTALKNPDLSVVRQGIEKRLATELPSFERGANNAANETANTIINNLGKVKDLKGLNKFRQQLDTEINYARKSATPDPAVEQVKQQARRAISDYIGERAPDIKPINELMSKSYDAQDFLKSAAKNPKGFKLPFTNSNIGGDLLQGAEAKAGAAAQAAGDAVAGTPAAPGGASLLSKGFNYGKALTGQELGRVVAGVVLPHEQPPTDQGQPPVPAPGAETGLPGAAGATPTPPGDSSGLGIDMQGLVNQALSNPDAKTQKEQLGLIADLVGIQDKLSTTAKAAKPVSSATNQQIANAQSGLAQLDTLDKQLSSDSGLPAKNAAASLLGNFGRGQAGTQAFDTARNEIVDVLARLRTGAAISKQEEAQYKGMLPTAFDSPDTIQQKLGIYRALFQGVLERAQAGSPNLELAGATASQ